MELFKEKESTALRNHFSTLFTDFTVYQQYGKVANNIGFKLTIILACRGQMYQNTNIALAKFSDQTRMACILEIWILDLILTLLRNFQRF